MTFALQMLFAGIPHLDDELVHAAATFDCPVSHAKYDDSKVYKLAIQG